MGVFVSLWTVRESSGYHVRGPNSVTEYQIPEFDQEIRTNSLGFPDIEHPVDKPAGEFRPLAIGDAFIEGRGARFEHTWLNALGRNLSAGHPGIDIRVMNGGPAAGLST